MLDISLWIIGIVVGVPIGLIIGLLALYLLFIFLVGVAVIPIAIAQRIAGTNKKS